MEGAREDVAGQAREHPLLLRDVLRCACLSRQAFLKGVLMLQRGGREVWA